MGIKNIYSKKLSQHYASISCWKLNFYYVKTSLYIALILKYKRNMDLPKFNLSNEKLKIINQFNSMNLGDSNQLRRSKLIKILQTDPNN